VITGGGGVDTLVMDPDDTRVVQPCGGARLALETLQEDRVSGEPGSHHLDGDRTLEPGVRAPVDSGHAATGQHRTDPVAPLQQGTDQVPVLLGSLPSHSSRIVGDSPRAPNGGRAPAGGYGIVTTVSDLPIAPDVLEPEVVVLPLPDVARRLGLPVTRVHQMLRDGQLLVPAEFLNDDAVVKGLPGTITLLRDAGYSAEEILRWLFTAEDSLPGTPIGALRTDRGREVKRRAQAMGF
jgi:Rv2175c C-terminal domain of unknown function